MGLINRSTFIESWTLIRNQSDFPNQDATTITLSSGAYVFDATVIITKVFQLEEGANVVFTSTDRANNFLIYLGSGTLFTGVLGLLFFIDIGIFGDVINSINPQSTLFDLDRLPGGRGTLFISACTFATFLSLGTVRNLTTVVIPSVDFSNFQGGLTFDGIEDFGLSAARINTAVFGGSGSGAALRFTGTFEAITCANTLYSPQTNESYFYIDPNITVNKGVFTTNVYGSNLGGTFFEAGSLDETDPRLKFFNNGEQKDSAVLGEFAFNNNASDTIITALNTPVLIEGVGVAGNLERFTFANNRLTYIGLENVTIRATAFARCKINANNEGNTYRVRIFRNGVALADSNDIQQLGTALNNPSASFNSASLVTLSPNDYLEVFVDNFSTTETPEDILFVSLRLIIS